MGALDQGDTPELRKSRGAFFTPPEVTSYLADWAIRSAGDRVLEPSCGHADFMLAAGRRLAELGANGDAQLHGVELHESSAAAARALLADVNVSAHIHHGDFFDAPLVPGYDAAIGNPPYVRYQDFSGESRAKAQRAALAGGVRLTGLASSWAAFTVRAAELLRPSGRLALVLPAELLTVNYAAPVRRYVLQRFASVKLIVFTERVFPGVIAEVVLLLAEGSGGTDEVHVAQANNLDDLHDVTSAPWRPVLSEAKWTPSLLPLAASDAYRDLMTAEAFDRLESWGRTDLGMVTGNNRYFCMSGTDVQAAGLTDKELIPISPPGSKHLRGLSFERRAWQASCVGGQRVYLFAPSETPSPAAMRYIRSGEKAKVHKAYKCKVRKPWWAVPRVPVPDLLLTYMNHDTPRLIDNGARVRYLNSVHGVRLADGLRRLGRDLLPLASLNSLTLLGAELTGRSYGGGLLKVEPKEADLMPVPSPSLLEEVGDALRAVRPQLGKHLRGADLVGAVRLVDRVVLVDGLKMKRHDLRELSSAREALFARRRSRSVGVAG